MSSQLTPQTKEWIGIGLLILLPPIGIGYLLYLSYSGQADNWKVRPGFLIGLGIFLSVVFLSFVYIALNN